MLYDRVASIVVGKRGGKAVEIKDLRFTFSIEKGATETPNKCTCEIYNLSPDSRALVETVDNVLILKAGYKNDVGSITLFTGTVTRALTKRMGPDLITSLEMMDGMLEYRDTKTTFSFAPGVTARQVLTSIASTFNLPVRPLPEDLLQKTYPNGFAFVGRSREAMAKACEYLDAEWSIQNKEIQIINKGKTVKMQAIVLSADSGMIGSPELEHKTMTEKAAAKRGFTEKQRGVRVTYDQDIQQTGTKSKRLQVNGLRVKCLLQPLAQPGGKVKLNAFGIKNEIFRIERLIHSGDTFGNDWMSELTLRYI